MGRVVDPGAHHAVTIERILKDLECDQVFFDISWDEVAINSYPDRFLFSTDEVAPAS